MEGLKTAGGVEGDSEVACKGWRKGRRTLVGVNLVAQCEQKKNTKTKQKGRTDLVVYQAPLLEKSMDAHDRADVASKVATTGSDGKILCRTQTIGVDHKVTVVLVYGRRLGPVTRVEEFWESTSLDGVDFVHVVPGSVARDDNFMRLGREVLAGLVLKADTDCLELGRVVVVVVIV